MNSSKKKKKTQFFHSYKKRLKKNFGKNILSLLKKKFSFKIKKLFSFEQTPYIGAFYPQKCLPLKYRKNIHISFFETFRYQF